MPTHSDYFLFYLNSETATFLTRLDGDCLAREALLRAVEDRRIDQAGEYLIMASGAWSTDPPNMWRYTVASRTDLYIV